MRAAIISQGSLSSEWTYEAMTKYFDEVHSLNIKKIEIRLGQDKYKIYYDGKPISHYDCFYVKGSFRFAPLLRSLTSLLHNSCYLPVKHTAFTTVHDKLLSHLAMQRHNIPMPTTYVSSSPKAAKQILERINYPIVLKFPQGTQGRGVMFADSYASASSLLDALDSLRQPFLIQEFMDTDGTDIRAIVVGDEVVASMRRVASSQEQRANIHAGGRGEPVVLDAQTKKIAVKTAEALGAEICGVDLLETPRGPMVLEANLSPGLQGITKATKVDVADLIARFLARRTQDFIEANKHDQHGKIMDEVGIRSTEMATKEILTNLDLRGNRILLPEVITNLTKFTEKDEILFSVKPGEVKITKFSLG